MGVAVGVPGATCSGATVSGVTDSAWGGSVVVVPGSGASGVVVTGGVGAGGVVAGVVVAGGEVVSGVGVRVVVDPGRGRSRSRFSVFGVHVGGTSDCVVSGIVVGGTVVGGTVVRDASCSVVAVTLPEGTRVGTGSNDGMRVPVGTVASGATVSGGVGSTESLDPAGETGRSVDAGSRICSVA